MRRVVLLILWLITDILIFIGAYVLAYFLRVGFIVSTDFPLDLFLRTVYMVAPLTIAVMAQLGVFRLMRLQSAKRNIAHIIFAAAMGSALFTLTYYFLYVDFFSRLLLVYAFVLSAGFLIVWHIGFEQVMRKFLRMGRPLYPTLIVGATREAASLIKTLNDQRSPLTPVAILDGRGTSEKEMNGVPVEGKLNKLEETITKYHITHLIQCSDLEQSINLLSACSNRNITYILLPSVLGMVNNTETIESIEGRQVAMVRPSAKWWQWFFG